MIPAPAQPVRRCGLGAVDWRSGEAIVITRRHKRRREVAELLEALLKRHPRGTVHVAWDHAGTHEDDEVEAVLRGAAGRLALLYLPAYSPWLNPAEMLWRHYRRDVTHCELFESVAALLEATRDFFDRMNQTPRRTLSIIGAHPAWLSRVYLAPAVSCPLAVVLRGRLQRLPAPRGSTVAGSRGNPAQFAPSPPSR